MTSLTPKVPYAVYAHVITLIVGFVLGYMLGMWHEDRRCIQERDAAVEQLAACAARNVARDIDVSARRDKECAARERALCDTRIEQLRVSYTKMKCELCK